MVFHFSDTAAARVRDALYTTSLYIIDHIIILHSKYIAIRFAEKHNNEFPDGIWDWGWRGGGGVRPLSATSATTMPANEFRDSASDTHRSSANRIIGSLRRILSLNCMKCADTSGLYIIIEYIFYLFMCLMLFLRVFPYTVVDEKFAFVQARSQPVRFARTDNIIFDKLRFY